MSEKQHPRLIDTNPADCIVPWYYRHRYGETTTVQQCQNCECWGHEYAFQDGCPRCLFKIGYWDKQQYVGYWVWCSRPWWQIWVRRSGFWRVAIQQPKATS